MVCSTELGEIVEGRLAIPNDASAGRQHCTHPADMPGHLAFAAKFGMGDRNQVMDEIDRPQVCAANPNIEPWIVEARVPDVEIKAAFPPELPPRGRSQDAFDETAPNAGPRP